MRNILILFLALILTSCKGLVIPQDLYGKYIYVGKDIHYDLELYKDSVFFCSVKEPNAAPKGYGKWYYIGNDTILLKTRNARNIYEFLDLTSLLNWEEKLKIINQNKLRLGKVVLRRVK